MRRQSRYDVSPIHKDIKYGSGGRTQGRFVINDGTPVVTSFAVENRFVILQESGFPIFQEDGSVIYT